MKYIAKIERIEKETESPNEFLVYLESGILYAVFPDGTTEEIYDILAGDEREVSDREAVEAVFALYNLSSAWDIDDCIEYGDAGNDTNAKLTKVEVWDRHQNQWEAYDCPEDGSTVVSYAEWCVGETSEIWATVAAPSDPPLRLNGWKIVDPFDVWNPRSV